MRVKWSKKGGGERLPYHQLDDVGVVKLRQDQRLGLDLIGRARLRMQERARAREREKGIPHQGTDGVSASCGAR